MAPKQYSRKTSTSLLGGFRCLLVVVGLFLGNRGEAQVVRHYADQVTLQSHVVDAGNAVDATDLTNFATLESYGGFLLGGGAYSGEIELQFPDTLSAGTTSYVHIDFSDDVLNALLGGNLGGVLADVVGSLILGNHFFKIEARMDAGSVMNGSSQTQFDTEELRLIIDGNGSYFLAITPSFSYNRIYIKDVTNAALLGTSNSMDVYSVFYITGQDPCETVFATSFKGNGITLDALKLGGAGVTNPEDAIDGDTLTYSEMSLGTLGIVGSLTQNIYFSSLSEVDDQFHMTIGVADPSLLNLGLLDGIKLKALNGTQTVDSVAVSTLLDLNLLNLITNSGKGNISYTPSAPFDRIEITISSTLQVNLTKIVNIYEVYRSPAPPTNPAEPGNGEICFDTLMPAILSATTTSDNELVWYADEFGGTALDTTAYNGTYTTDPLSGPTTFYVAAKRIACPWESSRIPIEIVELPDIGAPTITIDAVVD